LHHRKLRFLKAWRIAANIAKVPGLLPSVKLHARLREEFYANYDENDCSDLLYWCGRGRQFTGLN
jgi:hypothetical protein